ncbi:hypothetical protein DFH09DRAFT_1295347 [Mycena vulgaris]|nr:hypothetical protein DFH09DRAFT_1295347 [Mycena vulgaris]
MPDRLRKWVRGLRLENRPSSRGSPSVPASNPPPPEPPSASEPPDIDPKATSPANAAIDNLTVALGLVQQVANIVREVPFIAPAAALMAEILEVYKVAKATGDKRDVLLANIVELTRDLCGTILRMEATNHVDLIGRLKVDIEGYTALLARASLFIKRYDTQGVVKHLAARNELGSEILALNRELDSFGARFRTNRLVDLALNQSVNTRTLDRVHDMVLEEKLEKWLACPDMKQKQLETLELRHKGTGHWLLEGHKFIQWQDNPGSLWIWGPLISELVDDKRGFKDLANSYSPPVIAFFYFDFKDKQGQAVDSALRRIILQLSAQSPNPSKTLEEHYKLKSGGQTLPTYQELQKILEALLMELGHTYIILDALDECQEGDQRRLVDFISALRKWTQTPLHLLLTSQPRRVFAERLPGITYIELGSDLAQEDIRIFVESELQRLGPWASRAADRVVSKSNGMFRMAACLIVDISRCPWEDELDKTLDNFPDDLFGIYDRFLQGIRPEHILYAEAALRWLVFSRKPLALHELSDAIAFDFSDPTQYIYKPSRRERNAVMIPRWLEGLVTINYDYVVLAHSSVQDYLLSTRFTSKFGWDFSAGLSHTFLAQTCIGYLLYFADDPLKEEELQSYPLVQYAADLWCHHLLHSHDRTLLFDGAMRLLEDGSKQYNTLNRAASQSCTSPLHLCCEEGYIQGVRRLLETGANINLQSQIGNLLQVASWQGHIDIVCLLLESGADVNTTSGEEGTALQAASWQGYTEIVRLLLENGAPVNATGGRYGLALQAATRGGYLEIVSLLLEAGADVNGVDGSHGSALEAACRRGHTEIDAEIGGGYEKKENFCREHQQNILRLSTQKVVIQTVEWIDAIDFIGTNAYSKNGGTIATTEARSACRSPKRIGGKERPCATPRVRSADKLLEGPPLFPRPAKLERRQPAHCPGMAREDTTSRALRDTASARAPGDAARPPWTDPGPRTRMRSKKERACIGEKRRGKKGTAGKPAGVPWI